MINKIFQKITLLVICFLLVSVCSIYYFHDKHLLGQFQTPVNVSQFERNVVAETNNHTKNQSKMLVYTSGCTMWDEDPMDPTIRKFFVNKPRHVCANSADLPLTSLKGGKLILNKDAATRTAVDHCQYRAIHRLPKDDWNVVYNESISFNNTIEVMAEFLEVTCFDRMKKETYRNYHAQIIKKSVFDTSKRLEKSDEGKLNVLMIGIDSMSRLNFLRHGKKIHHFITTAMGGIELHGMNKVGYGTLSNLTPLLTGKYLDELPWSKSSTPFDGYNFIWKNFSTNGFATLYGEDYANGFTFNYAAGGFVEPPVDYYDRPFIIAVDKIQKRVDRFCIREKAKTKALLDWMTEYARMYQNNKYFGFLMFTNPTHDDINGMDLAKDDYYEFLKNIHDSKLAENTVIFIFGDHGARQGALRETKVGRYEAMLPFHYVILPKQFKEKHPKHYTNVLHNQRQLVTWFDLHETLKDLMKVDESQTGDGSINERGISLFKRIPEARTCRNADVPPQYCMCHYNPYNVQPILNTTLSVKAPKAAVDHINHVLTPVRDKCEHFKLYSSQVFLKHKLKDQEELIVVLKVSPGGAKFEVTVTYRPSANTFEVLGNNIDRINLYGMSSWCVDNKQLKLFCYCKKKH